MLGLMQDWPLTVDRILDHARTWHGETEIVSRSVEGPTVRTTYAELHARARRLSAVLQKLGVKPGERVATMAWNTARHMEVWYGIMGIGAVCHTLNPRLFPEQLCYIIGHAEDQVLLTDLTFLPIIAARRDQMKSVRHIIVMTDAASLAATGVPDVLCYEDLLAQADDADVVWGGFDENTAAGLCYTSGTTGNPKGVLYSHRSNVLHTLVTLSADVMGISSRDVVLPVVPMFHANAWGLAFSGPAAGAKLVLPGARLDGASIHELLETEGVTFSAAVPTVWQMLLTYLRETGKGLTTLKRAVIGGAAMPPALMKAFEEEYGVMIVHAWGMTETSPMGCIAMPTAAVDALPPEQRLAERQKQGRAAFGIELRVVGDEGQSQPHDGQAFGHLQARGPFVAAGYFAGEGGDILEADGFFDTGDVATIDPFGFVQITDRAKDMIKSGGEWISSIEIENLAVAHPKVDLAAVIGVVHPKWTERPLLVVKLKPGETATAADVLAFLDGKIARWWMPDDVVFVDDLPLGPTGKIDKKVIRRQLAGYVLPTRR